MPQTPSIHGNFSAQLFGRPKASLGAVPTGPLQNVKNAIDAQWSTIVNGNPPTLAKGEAAWLQSAIEKTAPADVPALKKHIAERLAASSLQATSADVKAWMASLAAAPNVSVEPTLPPSVGPSHPPVQPGVIGGGGTVVDAQTVQDFNREPPASNFKLNLQAANSTFHSNYERLADLFSSYIMVPTPNGPTPLLGPDGKPIKSPTHMMGQKEEDIRLIAYDDSLGVKQKDIARFLDEGEIAICIKHHSVKPDSDEKEMMKLQCTHIGIAVGVKDEDGEKGAITLNNPQNYQNGLFGEPTYPMIFIKPKFPSFFDDKPELKKAYADNIRTWAVIANTFTNFPGDYNGGDPLATRSPEQIKKLGDKLLQALAGTSAERQEAIAWLKDSKNQVYCAELAHVALNLGIHVPLNKETLGERFEAVKQALASKDFLSDNGNEDKVKLVGLKMAPSTLKPVAEVVPELQLTGVGEGLSKNFGQGLAIEPFTVGDIVHQFIQKTVPREKLGEAMGSQLQAGMLAHAKPALYDQLGMGAASLLTDTEKLAALDAAGISHFNTPPNMTYMDAAQKKPLHKAYEAAFAALPDTDPRKAKRAGLDDFYDNKLTPAVAKDWTNEGGYPAFRAFVKTALLPVAQSITSPRDDGTGAFVPPHVFLTRATDMIENPTAWNINKGFFQWQYVGHGLHSSMLDPKN